MAAIILNSARIKSQQRWAEADKIWLKGHEFWHRNDEESEKLWAEGQKLQKAGDKLYVLAIRDFFGEYIPFSWFTGEVQALEAKRAVMPLGELFGYNNLT